MHIVFHPLRKRFVEFLIVSALVSISVAAAVPVSFHTRSRQLLGTNSSEVKVVEKTVEWDPTHTAVVVCDMWDQHHCPDATERVAEMAPRMNEVLKAARARGMLVIHCPSDTLGFYKEHPARKLAQSAPKVTTTIPLQGWCSLNGGKEPPLPIDDSDGGCDGCPDCPGYGAWTRQHPALEIQDTDGITDSSEAFYLMRQRGITNVLIMGVHLNMCVLGRSFAIRQMVSQGQNVLLLRDMTDSMYNHRKSPYVSHFRGTELVVEHIETFWCPSITSSDLTGAAPFRFRDDVKKRIALVVGENEYYTWKTLPEFAAKELAWRGYEISEVMATPVDGDPDFKNVESLRHADLVLVSVRRRTPSKTMIALLRAHVEAGKPVVGIRTASHGFDAQPAGQEFAAWPTFDIDVLGAKYMGHYNNKPPVAPHSLIQGVSSNGTHPVMTGVRTDSFRVTSHLYKNINLASTTVPLLRGHVEGRTEIEPVAWVNNANDRRVFYTSLGNPDDFELPAFRRLLLNGILWCLHDPIPPAIAIPADYSKEWKTMKVPGTWEDNSGGALAQYDGLAWYKSKVELPPAWQGQSLTLEINDVDNAHEAFVNGVKVGAAGGMPPAYVNGFQLKNNYSVPAPLTTTARELWIAIRVYDHEGRGGFKGTAPRLHWGTNTLSLAGEWDFRTGDSSEWAGVNAGRGEATVVFRQPRSSITAATAVAATPDLPQETRGPALRPIESMKRFHVAEDLEWDQVLAEPQISQPVFLNFDERGRMWVVEFRQYPSPAGLTLVSRDSVWRAVYDKVPLAPPNHVKGVDRISIHEDTDGDGTYDRHKVFVDGLNIATAVERGRGGVWILNPPYLLFYRDANNDDVPDGDPEVRLAGFGLEDTHSVANSLRWGPDGWLYGAQGSTVTANIVVMKADGKPLNPKPYYSQGQNIWRYHPEKRIYEIFSEGGGNAFGCEIDDKGRIFSGHNGGDTRGFHYQQGAYLQKGFEKHGPLSNPYAFGYFPAMPLGSEPRFTHNFVLYNHGALPQRFAGKLLGVEPLQGRLVESDFSSDQSSFRTRDLSRPVTSDDRWFRPVDIKVGPDGAVYVCDWYDRQVNHYRNQEGEMDKANGRIYRLRSKGAKPVRPTDLSRLTLEQVSDQLTHSNRWVRQTALRLIGDRHDSNGISRFTQMLENSTGQVALEALWAWSLSGGLTEDQELLPLRHKDPYVRQWGVRLLGDSRKLTPAALHHLTLMATEEKDLEVRNQLAATARRVPAAQALLIIQGLCGHSEDTQDNRQPLLIWWAMETHCEGHREEVLQLFKKPAFWKNSLVEAHILERLSRRFAQAGARRDLLACAELFELAPTPESSRRLLTGFEAGFKGRSMAGLPEELVAGMNRHGVGSSAFALRRGDPKTLSRALKLVVDETAPRNERLEFLAILGEVRAPGSVPALSQAYRGAVKDDGLRQVALVALQGFDDAAIAQTVLSVYQALGPVALPTAQTLLASRPAWSLALARAIARKPSGWAAPAIKPESVPSGVVRKLKQHRDPELKALLQTLWPDLQNPTTATMDAEIQRRSGLVRSGIGDPYAGRTLFQNTCAACHKLFGQGGQVGPDLTVYNRPDLESMLLAVINPSAEIREGFENYFIETKDGRSLSGFLVEQDNRRVVLRGMDNQDITLNRADIVELRSAGASLMPEGLLDGLNDQQTRDLFAYLRSTQPLVGEAPRRTIKP